MPKMFFFENFRYFAYERDMHVLVILTDMLKKLFFVCWCWDRVLGAQIFSGANFNLLIDDQCYIFWKQISFRSAYADALREISAAREEVPGRRGYPGLKNPEFLTFWMKND